MTTSVTCERDCERDVPAARGYAASREVAQAPENERKRERVISGLFTVSQPA